MAQDTTLRRPLWNSQFAWLASKKDGTIKVVFGPDPLETTEDDLWLAQDPVDPTKVRVVTNPLEAIRDFIDLSPGKFAILTNPAKAIEDYPNGSWARGRKELAALSYGTKRVIASGHFPLWPGQDVEVKDVYRLLPSDYLIVQIVGDVDEDAPYYGVTARCASDIAVVVEETGETLSQPKPAETGEGEAAPPAVTVKSVEAPKPVFQPGQRIRISGTPTYIPPTGVEVVEEVVEGVLTGNEIRKAVMLGPTEFCSLIDRDGQLQRKPGQGRVFPGPYDLVQTQGSRNNGVYDAYHLRDDRGLLIRVVADTISAAELKAQLPDGVALLEETYTKGDEIFIQGVSAYLVPSSAIEVIDPETRLPHVGNDHSSVFVQAIGVDQKSGIYVADVKTGNVELVRGEKSEVLDPRYKKHVHRRVPGYNWNLTIGHGSPHKRVIPTSFVDTEWAIAVPIPNNEAVLITSRSGRRCVVGPCEELLLFDEQLQILGLSRGKPKSDKDIKETCFLRVDGTNVSDQVSLQTKDYVTVEVDLSYGVRFVGETDEERAKWFAYTNYVQFFCDHLRSVLRAEARKLTLAELIEKIAEFVRDTVLGLKPEDGRRTGRKFDENNMLVYEVEVLDWNIPDVAVADKISQTNRNVVTRQLDDADKRNALESQRVQAEADDAIKELQHEMLVRDKDLRMAQAEASNHVAVRSHELEHALQLRKHEDSMAVQKQQADLTDELKTRELARQKKSSDLADAIKKQENATAEAHTSALVDIEIRKIAKAADADVARLAALQPKLVEAITGAANAQLAGEVARHLPEASGGILGPILGAGGAKALRQFLQGTPMEQALNALESSSAGAGSVD